MNTGKILEALEDERLKSHRPQPNMNLHVGIVHPPEYNVMMAYFNDDLQTIEVSLRDIETGREICRHVFRDMGTYNAFIGQAFAPPDEVLESGNKNPQSVLVIEHKLT